MNKLDIIYENSLELIEDESGLEKAFASFTLNPSVKWIKFILLDDLPNKNGQRIPQEEFINIIRSGINMPVKMAYNDISLGHKSTYPLGVITNLVQEGNKIIGLAALWKTEREKDIQLLEQKFANKEPLNLSWELSYSEKRETEAGTDLLGVTLDAATFVGLPAYAGRTPVIAMASEDTEETKEDSKLEELEQLKQANQELTDKITQLEGDLTAKASELDAIKTELEELRNFKKEIEDKKAQDEKFASIKAKFSEAGLEQSEDYFSEKRDVLLAMNDDTLNFFIQELVSFKSVSSTKTEAGLKVPPNLSQEKPISKSPKDLAKALRDRK